MAGILFDEEAVAKELSEAILKSTLGEAVKKEVANRLKEIGSPYNNPIKEMVDRTVRTLVEEAVREDEERIKALTREALKDEILNDLIEKFISRLRIGEY